MPAYQPNADSKTVCIARASGVEIALDPFVEPERTSPFFGIDAVHDGIGILHVRVSNLTSDQTFLVEKRRFQLVPPGTGSGPILAADKVDRSTAAGEAVMLTGAGIGSLPMMFAGGAVLSRSTEIRRNFVSKEMPDQTLSPGQSVDGFIYYTPVAKKVDWSRGSIVRIVLTETRTRQETEVTVPLSR
jgi:hypothetical protein